MSIDVTSLVQLIKYSYMPEELKQRLTVIAQVASEEDKKRICEKVKNFDIRFMKIMQGKIRPKADDLIVLTGKDGK